MQTGLTPLHVASFMGHMAIVQFLIQNGANPDTPNMRGETALHHAARANQTDIMRVLLRNGAQVDARARENQTPLHIAARLGNTDNVLLLLQHHAAVDASTKDLYTPLHIACKEGHEETAAVLLEHGADQHLITKVSTSLAAGARRRPAPHHQGQYIACFILESCLFTEVWCDLEANQLTHKLTTHRLASYYIKKR